jgi:hypothetical protein
MKTILIGAMLAVSAGMAGAADSLSGASGSFQSQDITMNVHGAMAFRGKSIFDKTDVIIVAVTNARMQVDMVADYVDRRRFIERRYQDDDARFVYFEFRPDGRYKGFSYYFRSGNGCGYCGGGDVSTVKLAGGRLKGSLKEKEDKYRFDIALDVPVTSDDHGAPLPADGGAPGKVYLAYHAALVKRDAAALRPLLSKDQRETLAEAEKEHKGAKYLNYLAREHPGKSVQITGAFSKGDKAVLLIAGESTAGKVTGEVLLYNEAGSWHVDDELTDLVLK